MDYTEQNLKLIEDYFAGSCKAPETPFSVGVEIEHFLLDKTTHRSPGFDGEKGVEALLKKLAPHFEECHYQEGRLVGLDCREYNISLEPSCQFEISMMPEASLAEIERIYGDFRALIDPYLEEFHLELLNYGYNPYEKNADMELIPKKRYACMNRYFTELGTKGRYMMRSTASTQVSIDFYSEEDFAKKYKSAYIIGPLLSLFADNCPVFEGQPNTMPLRRQLIWRDVDPARVDVFSVLDLNRFGFSDYAKFLYDTPLVVLEDNGETFYTTKTPREIYAQKALTKAELLHILSMVFPMVRLKNYIEIRYADSLSIERSLQFTALIKGLYLAPEKLYNLISELECSTVQDILEAENAIMKKGSDAVIYGKPVSELTDRLLAIAKENLAPEERRYLC